MAVSKLQTEKTLLWTNPNLTADFPPQTILRDDFSEYKSIEVWGVLYTGFTHLIPILEIPIGMQGNLTGVAGTSGETSGGTVVVTRGVSFTSTYINATEGMGCNDNSTWYINNNNAIPYKIFGIK